MQIQLFSKEDELNIVQQVTQASLRALISMGLVDKKNVELKTEIHTIAYRKTTSEGVTTNGHDER